MQVIEMPKSRSDSSNTQVTPNPELEKRTRRRFPAEYKLRIIAEADACKHGELGAVAYCVVRNSIVTSWLIGVESMQNTASRGLAKACQVLHRQRPQIKSVSPSSKRTMPV